MVQVSLPVVRGFVKRVEEKALGVKVIKGVQPSQQLVKVVNDELISLMGSKQEDLVDPSRGPQVSCCPFLSNVKCPLCERIPSENGKLQAGPAHGRLARGQAGAVDCPTCLFGRCTSQQKAWGRLMEVPWQAPQIAVAQFCNAVREAVSCWLP